MRFEDGDDWPSTIECWGFLDPVERAVMVHPSDGEERAAALLADEMSEEVSEALARDHRLGDAATWPPCPHHPHWMGPAVRADRAVWRCRGAPSAVSSTPSRSGSRRLRGRTSAPPLRSAGLSPAPWGWPRIRLSWPSPTLRAIALHDGSTPWPRVPRATCSRAAPPAPSCGAERRSGSTRTHARPGTTSCRLPDDSLKTRR
jgi:hypothetical protein